MVVPTILERLGRVLLGKEQGCCCDPSSPAINISVRCGRCGEIIRSRIEKAYELEVEYDEPAHGHWEQEEPRPSGFSLHKELLGARCQNLVRVHLQFDAHRGMSRRQCEGGELVEISDCE